MNQKLDYPLLSIVTVTYNAERELKKTIESILIQKDVSELNIEYIIQDGLSKDRTLSVAKRYEEELKNVGIRLYIYSEKDAGIYDAMNKGIKKTTGKWICLLNAGDTFCNDKSLYDVKLALAQSSADVLYADYKRINSYIEKIVEIPQIEDLMNTMIFCHQAIFIRDYIYCKNLYDCKYQLVADYALMLKLYLTGVKFEYVPVCLIDYNVDGVSARNMIKTYSEIYMVRKDNAIIKNKVGEEIKYVIGILKRIILANMPQNLRWKIYNFLNEYYFYRK